MATLTVGADTPDFRHRRGGGCAGYSSCCGSYSSYGCYGGGYGGGCYGGGYGGGYGGCYGGGYGGFGCSGGYGGYGGMVVCSGGVIPGGGGTTNGKTNGTNGTTEKDLTAEEKARFDELTKTWDAAAKAKMLGTLRKLDAAGREETFKTIEEEAMKAKDKDKDKGDGDKDKDKDKDKAEKEVRVPTPANLIVVLPADATLRIDQAATTSTTSRRVFVTPPLAPGQTFHYTLDAEVVRDGVRVTQTQRVPVRAGERSRVIISFPETGVARR